MARVTVHHLTRPRNLPLIEEEGLRTRADLSRRLGPLAEEDEKAPGRYAHGKRVSAYLDPDHARSRAEDHGPGLVEFSVEPSKVLAMPGSARTEGPEAYWAAAQPLATWLAGNDVPEDLEVHSPVGVRAKFLAIRAPLVDEDDLGEYAPLVAAVADEDRLSAKALMHLAVVGAEGDFDSPSFRAACALAWRDEPDPPGLIDELAEVGADKVASAALAEFGTEAPEATDRLRDVLERIRAWADENGIEHDQAVLTQTAVALQGVEETPAT